MPILALVGCAHIHVPGFIKKLQQRPDFRVKSVWDYDADRAARRAAELSATVVADVNTIYADSEIEAVIVCSETDRHEALVLPAAAAKKHLFIEKPLGFGADDARRMAQAIDAAGVLFQTGYFMRGQPVHLFLKEHIANGTFGKITRIRHSNCHEGSLGGWFDTEWRWMADPAQAGVGAYGDLGTHSLDILMWLMGDVASVTARLSVVTGRYGTCDESGEGLLQFSNGVVGTLAAGWVDVANPITALVSGTEGHAIVRDGEVFIKSKQLGTDGKTPYTQLPAAQSAGFDLFLDALSGSTPAPLVTAQEAAARSIVMSAMYQAHEDSAWVNIS
jgi:predicted dehydrogenase